MANLLNFDAESGANAIGDDSTPTLTLENSSTGRALDVKGTSAAGIRASVSASAANATVIVPVDIVGTSIASGALFALINKSSFVSTSTIMANTAVAANCGAIRIVKPDGTFGWIPVYPDAAVTAIVV